MVGNVEKDDAFARAIYAAFKLRDKQTTEQINKRNDKACESLQMAIGCVCCASCCPCGCGICCAFGTFYYGVQAIAIRTDYMNPYLDDTTARRDE